MNTNSGKPPKELWLIHDPMDGPHLFRTRKEAEKMMKKWRREANGHDWDSFWDMIGPIKYKLAEDD